MGILQKADRCMDEAAALFGENKLFLAENKAQETAGLYKSCGAYEQMAKTVNFMGVIYASIGDVSMSIDCYLEAMDVAVEQGSTEIIMLVNNNIGSLYMELGLYEKAIRYFNEALELCKPPLHGERDSYYQELLMLHLNLCISYTGINEFEKAEKHLSDAILFNEIAGSDKNRFLIDMSQAHMLWKMGNEDEVRDHVEELVEGAINNINSANYVLEILSLCNLFMNMGEFDAWKKVIVEYERFAIETENLFFQKTCVKMWMKYESAMGDTEAYNKLCVYYANLHSMQVKEQIKRLGDTIDLKLQLQETEYERRKAVRLNYTDMLTGMGNKFKMRNDFEKLVSKNQDSDGAGITFGVVDIDFFKSFNRNSGRVTGDAFMNMGEFDAWKKVIVEYERFAIETENLFFQKTCVKMWMKYESAMGDTEAYNKLCVYYANLHSMQVKEQIKRLGDTIDLKLQLQETEYERRKAVRLNYTDMLTGMGNKFKMRNDFEKLVSKNQDSDGAGITFGVVDIDFFKSFNRNSGRVTGDAVLKEVSSIINESIKDKGMGYHFYGDEFYIILQETDEDIIKNIAEHIRLELAKKQILHESSKVDEYLTVSQAYVTAPDVKVPDEFSRLFKTVDEVLNDVKEKGRNAYKIV